MVVAKGFGLNICELLVLKNVDIQDPEDTGTEDEQGTDDEWTIVQRKKKNLVSGKKHRKVPNRKGSL